MARPVDPKLSEVLADWLFSSLVGAGNATLPEVNFSDSKFTIPWDANNPIFAAVSKPTSAELLAQFNALMDGIDTHITKEYTAGRITGAKYADVYLAMIQTALASAVQFVLGKDQAFWMAAKTQAEAITAATQNETAKIDAMYRRANYALTKLKLATEDSQFGQGEYQRINILPVQKMMVQEQAESQRAQTLDTRSDEVDNSRGVSDGQGGVIAGKLQGVLGTQKALYEQQVKSYQDDTQLKATRVFADLWTTTKTLDEETPRLEWVTGENTTEQALTKILQSARALALNGATDGFTPD